MLSLFEWGSKRLPRGLATEVECWPIRRQNPSATVMEMRVLVTGAAGFIGSHLAKALSTRGHSVVGLDDLSTGNLDNLDGVDIELIEGSILDETALAQAIDGADVVVHLAARTSVPRSIVDPGATHDVNITGTLRVLEAARRLATSPHLILASSSSVYGANPVLPKTETMAVLPMSPYAVSKLAAEQYVLAYHHSYGVPTLAFRFFNVFGPRQAPGHSYAAVIPAFVHAALRGQPVTIHGDGLQTRDFTYVGTVVDVITHALEEEVTSSSPVNLAMGSRTSLLEVLSEIERIVDRPIEAEFNAPRSGDVRHSQADSTLLLSLFPNATPVPLSEGLRATVDWMRHWLGNDS